MINIDDRFEVIDRTDETVVFRGACTNVKHGTGNDGSDWRWGYNVITNDGTHYFNMLSVRWDIHLSDDPTDVPLGDISKFKVIEWKNTKDRDIYADIYVDPPMDLEVVPLVEAMNELPGIVTVQSCCGHGEGPLWIKLHAYSIDGLGLLLAPLKDVDSPVFGKFHIELGSKCWLGGTTFGQIYHKVSHYDRVTLTLATVSVGQEAYDAANEYAETLKEEHE